MLFFFLYGCCNNAPAPILTEPLNTTTIAGETLTFDWEELVVDSTLPVKDLSFDVWADETNINIVQKDKGFSIEPIGDWQGKTTLNIEAVDSCQSTATLAFEVEMGEEISDTACPVAFSYQSSSANTVIVTGSFNDWDTDVAPMSLGSDNQHQQTLYLEPGAYSYKFVELGNGAPQWNCDPNSKLKQCDDGQDPNTECLPNQNTCNSLLIVKDCKQINLEIDQLNLNENEDTLSASIVKKMGPDVSKLVYQFDDEPLKEVNWNGQSEIAIEISGINSGRHRLSIYGMDDNGQKSNTLQVPFWTDDSNWQNGVMYFAFVDRFNNGDTSNDQSFDSSYEITDYMGGDWLGTIEKLPYLAELGVTALWLTAPLDNPEGAFDGSCNLTYTGYHGYWPKDSVRLESAFGDTETLTLLIEEAHRLGMRVLFDWVGNHVHEEHAHYANHPEWFTYPDICEDGNNWNDKPETCWFAPYLPTLAYKDPMSQITMIDEAMALAHRFNIDGFRVDAVKHIPMDVHINFQTHINQQFEHGAHWNQFDFYTVGETFSGDSDLLNRYIGPSMLDGQFNFDLYWSILSSIGREEAPLYDLFDAAKNAADEYGDALMCQFLGNHDVERFMSHAAGEVSSLYGDGGCPDGESRINAQSPNSIVPYQRLMNAWTWLLTQPQMALIYTGDEIGLPGYHDPDNRQMMRFDQDLSQYEEMTLSHVQQLSIARRDHPEIHQGEAKEWWGRPDPNVLATARTSLYGHSITIVNRKNESATIENGLIWAGLPTTGRWTDLLNGDVFYPDGDGLTLSIPESSSRVLVWSTD